MKYILLIKHLEAKKNDTDFPSQLKTGPGWKKKNCSCWTNAEASVCSVPHTSKWIYLLKRCFAFV